MDNPSFAARFLSVTVPIRSSLPSSPCPKRLGQPTPSYLKTFWVSNADAGAGLCQIGGIATASRKLKWGAAYCSMLCGCFPIVCNGCAQFPGSLYQGLPKIDIHPAGARRLHGCRAHPRIVGDDSPRLATRRRPVRAPSSFCTLEWLSICIGAGERVLNVVFGARRRRDSVLFVRNLNESDAQTSSAGVSGD
jgi:hypothetical protein